MKTTQFDDASVFETTARDGDDGTDDANDDDDGDDSVVDGRRSPSPRSRGDDEGIRE